MLATTTQFAPLSLPWPRRLGMRRSESARQPRLHKSECNCGHLLRASPQKNQQISLMIFMRLIPNLYLTQWVA